MESGISWKGNVVVGGGVIGLITVDWRKGCWGVSFVFSVCVCVWVFGGMRISANQVFR